MTTWLEVLVAIPFGLIIFGGSYKLLKKPYIYALGHTRITFSLLLGLILPEYGFAAHENGLLNYGLAVLVVLAVISILGMLPRTDWAIKFGTSLLLSFAITAFIYMFAIKIGDGLFKLALEEKGYLKAGTIVIGIGSVYFAFQQTYQEVLSSRDRLLKFEKKMIVTILDRLFASFIYSVPPALLVTSVFQLKEIGMLLALGLLFVLAYSVDIYLVRQYIAAVTKSAQAQVDTTSENV